MPTATKTDTNTLTELLAHLVRMPTVSDDLSANHDAFDYVAEYLSDRGMHVRRYAPTPKSHEALVASTRPDNAKTAAVLLAAHTDVIAAPSNLFELREEDGKYFGRGVYDMKCTIASYLKIVDELKDNLADYDFAILLTSDEELGSRDGVNGAQRFVEAGFRPQVLVLPDGGQSHWRLETSAKGYLHYALEAHGQMAHGSRPWEGENAVFMLTGMLHELKDHFKDHGPDTDTFNVGAIHSGEVANQVPHYARAEIEMRPNEHKSTERLKNLIRDLADKHNVHATLRTAFLPIENSLDNPYIRRFADCLEEVTGTRVTGTRAFGGSDARFFADVGVPYVTFYPVGGGHHSAHEWLDANALEQLKASVKLYLERVAKKPEE